MKKLSVIALVFVLLVSTIGVVSAGQEKVTVCHKPGTEDQATISIAGPALAAHLAHGDVEMACEDINTKSDLCTILTGYKITGATVTDFFFDTDLAQDETVTVTLTNYTDIAKPQNIWVQIKAMSDPIWPLVMELYTGGPLLQPGESSIAYTLVNKSDPTGYTGFYLFIGGQNGLLYTFDCN